MELASKSTFYQSLMSDPKAQQLISWIDAELLRRGDMKEIDFDTSAQQLRNLLGSGLLKMTDLRDDPEWFFAAHRIIACYGYGYLGEGFWTRFTVQYNLFAGTIVAVGSNSQVDALAQMQQHTQLGCFGLTEKFAGVSSGMVVETLATFDKSTREFVLSSPNKGAYKNWISQGFVADKSVVVADLRVDGKSYGPHAFVIDFRVDNGSGTKEVVQGVRLADMGRKTVANDLDNAWIAFDDVRVPESCLLDKFAHIDQDGKYAPARKGMHPMIMIGQRLFTGRVAVAQAALMFGRQLFGKTRQYTDKKPCWTPKGRFPLSVLPQLAGLFKLADEAFSFCERYTAICEAKLCAALRSGRIPSPKLIEAIATAKIRSVETVIQLCFRLKQTVGSYALMIGSGFEVSDTMQIAKFAEGESFVLMQKLARDRVKSKKQLPGTTPEEQAIVDDLRASSKRQWVEKTDQVYALAELVMDRVMQQWTGEPLPAGIARPWGPAPQCPRARL